MKPESAVEAVLLGTLETLFRQRAEYLKALRDQSIVGILAERYYYGQLEVSMWADYLAALRAGDETRAKSIVEHNLLRERIGVLPKKERVQSGT